MVRLLHTTSIHLIMTPQFSVKKCSPKCAQMARQVYKLKPSLLLVFPTDSPAGCMLSQRERVLQARGITTELLRTQKWFLNSALKMIPSPYCAVSAPWCLYNIRSPSQRTRNLTRRNTNQCYSLRTHITYLRGLLNSLSNSFIDFYSCKVVSSRDIRKNEGESFDRFASITAVVSSYMKKKANKLTRERSMDWKSSL